MTFSFKPSKLSILLCIAASIRIRVVSWKDAAEMKERVWRDADVIPWSTGSTEIGFLPADRSS